MTEKRIWVCNICGDRTGYRGAREHLAEHHPHARDMDWEDIRGEFHYLKGNELTNRNNGETS